MNNTTKTFLVILLLLVIAAGAYFFLGEEINTSRESSPQSDSSQQVDSKPSVEEQLSDRADTFSVSGEQAELFSKVVFNPFYLNPGETQQLFLKLHNPEQVEKATAEVEDGTGSKKLTLERMETADMGVVFTAEWTPKQVRGGETYPIEFSYTSKDGQNELTLHWEVEQQTSLIDQMLASLIPKARAADTCSELENNAEGNVRITENCQIGPDREIGWGVNNGDLTVDAGVTLTLVSNTTLDVNGNLTVGGLIQMNKNTTIRFEQGKSVLPNGMIAKSQGNTVIKKGAQEVIIKECSPGETTTKSDTCTYACCNEDDECELNGCTNTDTVTIECTNYTWEDKEANATCTDECVLEDEKVCHDGNVWWQDSCGSFTEKVEDCDTYSNSTCSDGQCVCNPEDCSSYECGTHDDGCGGTINCGTCCESHDYKACYNNDLYWYDSCNNREDRVKDCGSSYCDTGGDVYRYCNNGDVWGRYDYLERGCSGGSCDYNWNYNSCGHEKLKDCPCGCSYGSCDSCCSDECSYYGQDDCSGTSGRTCGDYDSDDCLEWSSWNSCDSDCYYCGDGTCDSSCGEDSSSCPTDCGGGGGLNVDLPECPYEVTGDNPGPGIYVKAKGCDWNHWASANTGENGGRDSDCGCFMGICNTELHVRYEDDYSYTEVSAGKVNFCKIPGEGVANGMKECPSKVNGSRGDLIATPQNCIDPDACKNGETWEATCKINSGSYCHDTYNCCTGVPFVGSEVKTDENGWPWDYTGSCGFGEPTRLCIIK